MTSKQACSQTIEVLEQQFGGREVSFLQGRGGLPYVRLATSKGHSAEIYLHGATLTSWCVESSGEQLFLSDSAIFSAEKAVRGGIPLVFPQFGPGTLASHGFARNRPWHVVESKSNSSECSVALQLEDDEGTRALWPNRFVCRIRYSLSTKLQAEVTVSNTDRQALQFQWAFHTYFKVADIAATSVRGLSGLPYLDNLKSKQSFVDQRALATISEEVDRIYCDAPDIIEVLEHEILSMTIEKNQMPDAVLWNPWAEKSKGMSDLAPDAYRRFVCVECGAIAKPIVLNPGEVFSASMSLATP